MPTQPLGEHIVTAYEDELSQLAQSISEMGGLAEAAVGDATRALLKLDHDLARETVGKDKVIDGLQRVIDERAVSMIARRQPMARDLRVIITSIHVANDLERVGDMAKTIARRTLQIDPRHLLAWLELANLADTPEEAWGYIQQARALEPNHPRVVEAVNIIWPQIQHKAAGGDVPLAQPPFPGAGPDDPGVIRSQLPEPAPPGAEILRFPVDAPPELVDASDAEPPRAEGPLDPDQNDPREDPDSPGQV